MSFDGTGIAPEGPPQAIARPHDAEAMALSRVQRYENRAVGLDDGATATLILMHANLMREAIGLGRRLRKPLDGSTTSLVDVLAEDAVARAQLQRCRQIETISRLRVI